MVKMYIYPSKRELKAHRKTVGGSDAPALMKACKYRTILTLWREKCGFKEPEDIEDRPFVEYGRRMEPIIREAFRFHHPELAVGFEENNMWVNDRIPFAHASLNGWVEDTKGRHGLLITKTTEITSQAKAAEWNKMPLTYYWQMIHCLMVTEFEFGILCAELKVNRSDGSVEWRHVERRLDRKDVLRDIYDLETIERGFMWHVEDKTEPRIMEEKKWKIG